MIVIIIVLSLIALVCVGYFNRSSKQIAQWRRTLNLDKHAEVFKKLYAEVDSFALSKQAREEQDAIEYVYGEIEFETFIALLSCMHLDSDTVFYDLGSGSGKAVLACAMVFEIKKSCGIELFPALHESAVLQSKRLSELPDYYSKSQTIEFLQGDFMDFSLADATVIFINASAFFGDYWKTVSQKLEELTQYTIVLTTSKKLNSNCFNLLGSTKIKVSWGVVSVYIQQRC